MENWLRRKLGADENNHEMHLGIELDSILHFNAK